MEECGGMLINNGKRRRTPGGVFLQLFKMRKDISDEIKVTIKNQIFYKFLEWINGIG